MSVSTKTNMAPGQWLLWCMCLEKIELKCKKAKCHLIFRLRTLIRCFTTEPCVCEADFFGQRIVLNNIEMRRISHVFVASQSKVVIFILHFEGNRGYSTDEYDQKFRQYLNLEAMQRVCASWCHIHFSMCSEIIAVLLH